LITAGIINTSEISIMNYDEPVFRWDAYGLTALDSTWYEDVISDTNPCKFVRFDKHGIYGINNSGVTADSWHPSNLEELDNYSTFSLTWDGLKVTKEGSGCLRIGKMLNGEIERILQVTKSVVNNETGKTDEVVTFAIE
jgi:hypothetical protein